jgi:phytanoyl-CoA hydroxylase
MSATAETLQNVNEQFNRDGYVVSRQLFSSDEIDHIRATFMELAKDGPVENLSEMQHGGVPRYSDSDPLKKYPRMMHPHLRSDLAVGPLTMKYMLHLRVGELLRGFFDDEPLAVQSMFYFKPPGARGQDLHQDNFYLRVKPGTCVAAWTAIDDADEENGGMVVVPGSNNLEIACPEKADPEKFFTTEHVEPPPGMKVVPVNLKAGDVMFFNGSVIHGSYPNTSKERFRRALICHYIPASSRELSTWYRYPTRFDGSSVDVANATGGGPCGTPQVQSSPH